jgi:hypothetical protein
VRLATVAQRCKPQEPENQKAKGKNQKAKISEPGQRPGWEGIFAARKEMGL